MKQKRFNTFQHAISKAFTLVRNVSGKLPFKETQRLNLSDFVINRRCLKHIELQNTVKACNYRTVEMKNELAKYV